MRIRRGLITTDDPDPRRGDPRIVEVETFTCAHCNRVREIHRKCKPEDAAGWCYRCDSMVCAEHAFRCDPTEEKLLRTERAIEAKLQRDRDYGLST